MQHEAAGGSGEQHQLQTTDAAAALTTRGRHLRMYADVRDRSYCIEVGLSDGLTHDTNRTFDACFCRIKNIDITVLIFWYMTSARSPLTNMQPLRILT